jgi:hypothetical protein
MFRAKRNFFTTLLCLTLLLAAMAAPLSAQPGIADGEASPWTLLKTLIVTIWAAVNQGPVMDPSGEPSANQGPIMDPAGEPSVNQGPIADPSGEPSANQGPIMDPSG